MEAMESSLKATLFQEGIGRPQELTELLETVVTAYQREFPDLRSVILWGGITLGEYHRGFSDIDLAVVFEHFSRVPPNRLPEGVRQSVEGYPLLADTHVSPKHVNRSTLRTMRASVWATWAEETTDRLVADTPYPFTLCDTWLLHHHGVVLAGRDLREEFPFPEAPPTTPGRERAQVGRFADRFARTRPFGGLEGEELVGEVIYYATTFTRAIYTLRTGRALGRVASTQWYHGTFGGELGKYVLSLGEYRRSPDPSRRVLSEDPAGDLWPLFLHYVREVLDYSGSNTAPQDPPRDRQEFPSWWDTRTGTGETGEEGSSGDVPWEMGSLREKR